MRQIYAILMLLLVAVPAIAFAGTTGPSPIPNPPSFQVSTNTLLLCKGVVNYVPITVSNLGKLNGSIKMESLQLGLTANKYLVTVENGSTNTATLPPNTNTLVILPIFVNLNTSTLISAGVSVNYNYLNYYSDSEVRNISFGTESCPSQLSVSILPKVLISGKIENASFLLSNYGSTPLTQVSLRASLPSQQGEILSSQPISVGSISPFSNATIKESMFIYGNASQTFPINVSLSFYNGSRLDQMSDEIAVLSSGIVNLTPSSITISPTAPAPGSIFSISMVLTNLGTTSASAITATVLPPYGLTTFGSNSVFVGTMEVNSQTPVTLTLSSLSSAKSGNYVVPIEISYLNNLRQQINSTIDVPVVLTGAYSFNALSSGGKAVAYHKSGSGGVLLIVVIILLIAVISLAFLLLKEKKKHKVAVAKK